MKARAETYLSQARCVALLRAQFHAWSWWFSSEIHNMVVFPTKKYRTPFEANSFSRSLKGKYLNLVYKYPALVFGAPFVTAIVAGAYFLSFATATRYEKHDQKVKSVTEQEAIGLDSSRRKIDVREEYYVSGILVHDC